MSLTLYFHPLSSFCWKALIGLYELEVPFEKRIVDLANDAERAAFLRLWPIGKFPVLWESETNETVPESSIVLEYVDRATGESGRGRLIPKDPARALECRLRDRIYDQYIHLPMQTIVGDRLRPAAKRDPLGVDAARARIEQAYALVEDHVKDRTWSLGDDFTLADCAAMPALYYGNKVVPLGDRFPQTMAYLARLERRPSVARVLEEAAPYFAMFPE